MRTMLDVSAAVGEADGGTAWVVTLLNVCAWLTGLFPEQAQDDVFKADPDALVSGVLAPTAQAVKVDGGWRITGRWYYNSGSWHATWAVLGIPVTDESGEVEDQGVALIPAADMVVEDTWFVAGMKSSGSNCLVADRRIRARAPGAVGAGRDRGPLRHRAHRRGVLPLRAGADPGPGPDRPAARPGPGRAGPGAQQGGARSPSRTRSSRPRPTRSAFQLQVAEAAMLIDTAHLHAYRAADDIDRAAASGEYLDYLARARVRADTGYVAEKITRAIDILLSAHGAGSFADVNPLQRIWRDSATAARHAVVSPIVGYEVYGKALLGVEEKITPLV